VGGIDTARLERFGILSSAVAWLDATEELISSYEAQFRARVGRMSEPGWMFSEEGQTALRHDAVATHLLAVSAFQLRLAAERLGNPLDADLGLAIKLFRDHQEHAELREVSSALQSGRDEWPANRHTSARRYVEKFPGKTPYSMSWSTTDGVTLGATVSLELLNAEIQRIRAALATEFASTGKAIREAFST
jgi:hypothetical protein